ncbi:hypothetical protein CAPTEDRAFT_185690 [Capitella teleta]|uniref:G-protein coupled receptors family 1 profile domain-containing protein n=1 Tax=Capitella teleta TaxID=283909 RepID=R7TAH3_CAPTE|nr:hypothetical protein CAPTEDRAFT_185690 [Capitella teleta]|eukprot:ELT90492.1 hypothetical protein CAPTEDRAFT_185690 [Capitella teleta]
MEYAEDDQPFDENDWLAFFNASDSRQESSEDVISEATLDEIFRGMRLYLPPNQIVLSMFGNIFAIWVFSLLESRVDDSDVCCKVVMFIDHLFLYMSLWMTGMVNIENIRFHIFPETIHQFSFRRITDVVCLLGVVIGCFNLHYFWTYGVIAVEFDAVFGHVIRDTYCFIQTITLKGTHRRAEGSLLRILNMALLEYVPVAIAIACMTITCLVKHGRIKVGTEGLHHSGEKYSPESQPCPDIRSGTFDGLVWLMTVTFLPKMIVQLLDKEDSISAWSLVSAVVKEWKLLFFSCKFYIYLACSARVRQELCLILSPLLKKGSQVISRIRTTYESCSLRLRTTREGPIELPMDWESHV